MLRIIISDLGKQELDRLSFDMGTAIEKILGYVPKRDLTALDHILITDLPQQWSKHLAKARASYYEKQGSNPAYIELYLKRMFNHIKDANSLNQMLPIQYVGIAQTIFHEIGHHVERRRSHRVKKNEREKYAGSYAKRAMNGYILENAYSISSCFDCLEKTANERGLSLETLRIMRSGWEKQYNAAPNGTSFS